MRVGRMALDFTSATWNVFWIKKRTFFKRRI